MNLSKSWINRLFLAFLSLGLIILMAPPAPAVAVDPETTIDSSIMLPSSATFAFSSDQSPVTFECQLDLGGWVSCTSPTNFPALAVGSHTFEVKATNTDTLLVDLSPATHDWEVFSYRPDARIKASRDLFFLGDDFYADELYHDATNQTVQASVRRGGSVSYDIGMQNDGVDPDRFVVHGCRSSNGLAARYSAWGYNVTTRVVAGTYVTPVIPSGATLGLRLTISTSRYMAPRVQGCNISFASVGDKTTYDWNRAETTVFK